jgi:CubicO group peptidase (beta-lactamase class C family)
MMQITYGQTDCLPEAVNYDVLRLPVLDDFFRRMIKKKTIQCASYCLSRHGKVFANAAIGPRSIREDSPLLTTDSVYGAASVTKTFTAAAIMQLVEAGFIRPERPVAEVLPQFAKSGFEGVTFFHLLTHTSGLHPDGGCFPGEPNAWEAIGKQAEKDGPDTDWIEAGISIGLRRDVGAEWQYCSFGFAVLGAVIEKITGVKAEKYIEANICKPLGMDSTAFKLTPDMARRALIKYEDQEERYGKIINGTEEKGEPSVWDKIPSTGGGLYSTVEDLNRYGNMYINHGRLGGARILGRKSVERMSTAAITDKPDSCWGSNVKDRRYAVGMDMRQTDGNLISKGTFFHEGAGGNALVIDPEEGLVAMFCVPFVDDVWEGDCIMCPQNIIWSGIM